MKKYKLLLVVCLLLIACGSTGNVPAAATAVSTALSRLLPENGEVPSFGHVILIVLENRDYKTVVNGSKMPHLKQLAEQNVLLTNYFAVGHPSLPNYLALVSGSTAKIESDCTDCFVNSPNLADLLEASGHTWKTYQENMPSPCFIGDATPYYQKHNPFVYFDSIRLNTARCDRSVVPLTTLDNDLANNQLPNFAFIMPNSCDSGHSCPAETADGWVSSMVQKLQASPALGKKSLIIVTFDEGSESSTAGCCGMGSAGGQVATVLISPLAKKGFRDDTAYSHYSLLKTILASWKLPDLGSTGLSSTQPILAPWQPASP